MNEDKSYQQLYEEHALLRAEFETLKDFFRIYIAESDQRSMFARNYKEHVSGALRLFLLREQRSGRASAAAAAALANSNMIHRDLEF